MVTASYTYFPGLPVFFSKNGVSWSQIGNVINSREQLDMRGHGKEKRLMSPVIRFDSSRGEKGRFYCLCNQLDGIGIFLCYSDDIKEGWSKPVHIEGAEGYDPSLFFDDDGTAWYCGVREASVNKFYDSQSEVFLQKIDLDSARLIGEQKIILQSESKRTGWIEAPHIFKRNGKYYLIFSEGGYSLNHGISIARSEKIDEGWEQKDTNPVFTHRNMGKGAGILNVGHGDIFEDRDGRWWLAVNGCRPYGEKNRRFFNMDRETFIVPVKWEDDWPLFCAETGKIENAYSLSGLVVRRADADADAVSIPVIDDFNDQTFRPYWLTKRTFCDNLIKWNEVSGMLRLYGGLPLQNDDNLSLMFMRQTSFCFEACSALRCHFANEGDCAGIICYQNENYSLRLQLKFLGMVTAIELIKTENGREDIVKEVIVEGGTSESGSILRIVAEKQLLKFEYGPDERCMKLFADNIDSSFLSPEKASGSSGVMVGMFAVCGGDFNKKEFYCDFDWFKYENFTREFTS